MSEWSNLPNAAHIDRVLAQVRAHPDKWTTARNAAYDAASHAAWSAAWDAAWTTARNAARSAVMNAARSAAWGVSRGIARGAARNAARSAAMNAARSAAWDACAALVAWDEAGDLLSAPVVVLRFLAQEEAPAAVLLLPAAIAMEVENERVE